MCKLNIDGSARDNIITGGGVIWDSFGRFIAGFSIYFGNGKNTLAEFLALREGLYLCRHLHSLLVFLLSMDIDTRTWWRIGSQLGRMNTTLA